ncbi:MAG: hypothetical protein MZW92_30970 [Comamonadaceae bacterium]|nr:hypothetical protein [Comamonadaceae bacterium]
MMTGRTEISSPSFTSSIESRKGQDILIKALAGLPKHYADGIEAYVIGRRMDNVDGRAFYEKISGAG